MEKTKSLGALVIKILISGLLLIFLMQSLDWQIAQKNLQSISITSWMLAFFLYLIAQIVSALRWMLIGKKLSLVIPDRNYFDLYFLGIFCNLFLPTGIGGDVMKSYTLGRASGQPANAISSVILDRVFGLIILLGLGALAGCLVELRPVWLNNLLFLSATLGIFLFFAAPKISQWLSDRWKFCNVVVKPINQIWQSPSSLIQFSGLSLLVQLFTIAAIQIFGWELGIDHSFLFFITAWSIISVISLFPLAINGFGIREFGFVMLFVPWGTSQESALILSFLSFSLQLATGLLGLIPFLNSKNTILSTSTNNL